MQRTDFIRFFQESSCTVEYHAKSFQNEKVRLSLLSKQAGTGPSGRHIQGSKIAKGHQSFKVFSSTALNFFWKKSQRRKKIERGDPLGFFYTQSVAKPKKNEGGPFGQNFFFRKKVSQCRKKLKGGPFGLVRHCMLCGKLFGSVPWANRWNLKFCRTFGQFRWS